MINFSVILSHISYKDWIFFTFHKDDYSYLQIMLTEQGNEWKSRKWLLSDHMTESEFIQTVFLAVMTAEEHEIREKFTYYGEAVLSPHTDLNKIASFLMNGVFKLDARSALEKASQDALYQKTDSTSDSQKKFAKILDTSEMNFN